MIVAFCGHRRVDEPEEVSRWLEKVIDALVSEGAEEFWIGGKGDFDRLCHALVSEIKEKHPHIKRIYVRAEFPFIRDDYRAYLLQSYEDTDFPQRIMGAGRAAYVERNYEMIHRSQYCVVYYNGQAVPTTRKSGTKIALDYAIKKGKVIITFP